MRVSYTVDLVKNLFTKVVGNLIDCNHFEMSGISAEMSNEDTIQYINSKEKFGMKQALTELQEKASISARALNLQNLFLL